MKKILLMIALAAIICSCGGSASDNDGDLGSGPCKYNGHRLYTGEKGGCYYISSGGSKEYVDKSYCIGCN
ncbi:MAG: hypothetical protein MUW56_06510 [Chryseobacterium sp.]|uniref:hypothetical protein n=1 Tax=Chryseobacterium sp. TaxID=1871047 RepID=UPI0025C3046E|nr:hypothetical protein [Chryseobacterium sp.]MCJ7933285.1 hypothetical protein [Chryseobacterium sp.]